MNTHYPDFRAAIREVEADAVIITLPVHLHAEAILAALDAGLHVLCEKPAVANSDELERIVQHTNKTDRTVMIAQNYRYRDGVRQMRAALGQGLGPINRVSLRFSQPDFLEGGRQKLKNPLLDDMMIHHVDLVRFVTGQDIVQVYASEYRPPWSRYEGAPNVNAILTLTDGSEVSYSGSWDAQARPTPWDGDWIIDTQFGSISMQDLNVAIESDPPLSGPPYKPSPESDLDGVLTEFLGSLGSGQEPSTSPAENAKSLATMFALSESIEKQRPVEVSTIESR